MSDLSIFVFDCGSPFFCNIALRKQTSSEQTVSAMEATRCRFHRDFAEGKDGGFEMHFISPLFHLVDKH